MQTLGIMAHAVYQTLRIATPTLIEAARGTLDVSVCDERLDGWARQVVRRARLELDVIGGHHVGESEAFVVMSNHQSFYDIPVIFCAFGRPLRMVAKKELFRIPVFAQAMRVARFVEVDRQNRSRAIQSLMAARETLDLGVSIWIAPEGTRSDDGRLGAFKKGGFHLALETGARILPLSVDGTRHVLAARGMLVRPGGRVRVTISPPIDPREYGAARRADLMAAVRTAIASGLPEGA